MSFDQLVHVSRLGQTGFECFGLVHDWKTKREYLAVYLQDLPTLVHQYEQVEKAPYELNPRITIFSGVPEIRLASACEAAANCVYGMAEIAAQFGNQASNRLFPPSFNALRKRIERGAYAGLPLPPSLLDIQWYRKIRELRTEWTHFSTVFIGKDNEQPIIVVRCRRRASDRLEFADTIQVRIPDLLDWISRAVKSIDGFGNYLLEHHIIPNLDPGAILTSAKLDSRGCPIITEDHRFEVERITVEEHLARCGIRLFR